MCGTSAISPPVSAAQASATPPAGGMTPSGTTQQFPPTAPSSPSTPSSPTQSAVNGANGAKAGGPVDGVAALGGDSGAIVTQLQDLITKLSAVLDSLRTGVAGASGGGPVQQSPEQCDSHGGPKTDVKGANGGPDPAPVKTDPVTPPPTTAVNGANGGPDPAKDKVIEDATKLGGPAGSAVAGVANLDINQQITDTLRSLVDVLSKLINTLQVPTQGGGPAKEDIKPAGGDTTQGPTTTPSTSPSPTTTPAPTPDPVGTPDAGAPPANNGGAGAGTPPPAPNVGNDGLPPAAIA